MQDRVLIGEIAGHEGQRVELRGWLYNRRSGKNVHFLQLRDGSGIVQCVAGRDDVPPETFELAGSLSQETSLIVTGAVRRDPRSPIGYELHLDSIEKVGDSVDFPISKKDHGTAFLMDQRHLWLRSRRQHAILRVRHELVRAVRDYLDDHGFINADSPIFTPAACEGTTTLFGTDYFGTPAYLSQSGQLYNEATAMAHGRVYCFGPTFRAEKSKTRRHLTEFWMVEPEMAWCDLDQNMDLIEDFLVFIVGRVLERRAPELSVLERDTSLLAGVRKPFPRITYDEAARLLHDKGTGFVYGNDFGAEDETAIGAAFDRPVMVHRWPAEIKAFYMKRDPADHGKALGVDVIAPEGYGEIVGGGQREDDHDTLLSRIRQHNLPVEAFDWYLDLRRYGSVPHSGFGMGVERTLSWLCGLHHVRETIPFPRLLDRLKP